MSTVLWANDGEWDSHCFVCNRTTDHFAEHDALVDAGLALYGDNGSVYRTDAWDPAKAAEISQAEYEAFCAEVGCTP